MGANFVPVEGQSFRDRQDWINRATACLTSHPDYFNAEHDGDGKKGWRGNHFTAMCFDQLGRRCKIGADFSRATRDNAYPIWWVWPDQIAELIMAKPDLGKVATALHLMNSMILSGEEHTDISTGAYEAANAVLKNIEVSI